MAWILLQENIVVQKQPYEQDGFIEAPDSVVAGMIFNGSSYVAPDPQPPATVAYPTTQIIADRATGEPYEVFVENGVLTSEPLGESNG